MKNNFTQNLISSSSKCIAKWLVAIALPLLFIQSANSQLNYVAVPCADPYVQIQGAPGTVFIGSGDDPIFLAVPIGFNFNFYTTTYTSFSVGNNGFMVFPSGAGAPGFGNATLPTAIAGAHMFPFWDDLWSGATVDPASGLYRLLEGVAPNRILTVEWYRVGLFDNQAAGIHGTFQVKLFETTNRIQFKYQDVTWGATGHNGGASATIGVEGPLPAPRPFTLYSFNTASITAPQCIEWVLPAACNPMPSGPITANATFGTCEADGVVVPLPTFSPPGCADGVVQGIRYSVNGGPFTTIPPPYPPSIIVNNLPVGINTIVWQAFIISNGATSGVATQTITVVDVEPPAIVCPADIGITLLPGECDAFVNYVVSGTDNCPGPVQSIHQNLGWPQVVDIALVCSNAAADPLSYYRLFNINTNITANSIDLGVWRATPGSPFTIRLWSLAGVPTNPINQGNMTLLSTTVYNPLVISNATTINIPLTPTPILAGTQLLVEINASGTAAPASGSSVGFDLAGETAPTYVYGCFNTPGVPAQITGGINNLDFFSTRGLILQINLSAPAVAISQTEGLASGEVFPIGTTTNCFLATDAAGNTSTCCFDVTIAEFPNPTTTLACNDNIQVSVNENCEAFVTTDMILEGGPYGCYDDYLVAIQGFGSGFGGVLINSSAIGATLTVTVTDPTTGNSCWGTISVEDKLPPIITCEDLTVTCPAPLEPVFGTESGTLFGSANPNLPILDVNTVSTQITIPSPAPGLISSITDVNVSIDLNHTWVGDLNIRVVSPSGQTVTLFNSACTTQDDLSFTIDDEAAAPLTCAVSNSGGTFSPGLGGGLLSGFDGGLPGGVWTISILDVAFGDIGTLNFWSLQISYNAVAAVTASDNCGDPDLSFVDIVSGDPCEGQIITRIWTATDESGNTATCDQVITVLPAVIDDVVCPPAFVGSCSQGDEDISPDVTGWPTMNGVEITDETNVCNIFVGYWDKELNDCGEGVKIIRTWTILDWCTQDVIECVQVIKVSDDEAPILTCPNNITVGTDFWYCYANVSVPKPTVFDECGSSWTLALSSSAGIIVNFGNNFVINQLGLGVHIVTWTATDECLNVSTCTFTITVVDDVAPVALCDEHTVVSLTNDGPFGVTLVPAEVFDDGSYDACGPVTFMVFRMPEDNCPDFDYFDWTTNGACIDHIPGGVPPINSRDRGNVARPCVPFFCCDVGRGPIRVVLEVEDAAGNVNTCMVEAIVQDKISPFVECPPDITVSCDFWFAVEEGTFSDANGNNNGNLDEDPLSHVFGNMFDAFRYNDDESFREDIIINDPGALPFITPQPHFWGIDGWADDNCEVNLSVRVRVFDDCSGEDFPVTPPAGAVRLIERRFSASDGGAGIAPGTCTQRIWVVDFDPFYIDDETCFNADPNDGVIWPCDVILTTCPDDIGDLAGPIVFDDACSLIGVAFEDTRFNFVDGACFKILRKWSVIDWCQYNPLTGEGIWMYVQVIKVHDHDGPEFLDCPVGPVVLCVADEGVSLPSNNQAFLGEDNPLASRCSAHLNLCKTVHETCSDFVDFDVKIWLHNGPSFIQVKPLTTVAVDSSNNALLCFDTRQSTIQAIRLNGIPYNSMWCGDYHRILWSVEDDCGNFSFCEYLFRLEDCKQPSPVCINGLSTVVMPIGGQVTIWAKDFDASSFDDCTPSDSLLFSFSGDSYQPSFTYTCENVPAFGVELSVNIWVADYGTDDNCNGQISWAERNKDFCTTTIVITDNAGVCPGDTTGSVLDGEILTEDVQSVEKVIVTLTSPGHVFPTYVTVEDGKYHFGPSSGVILPANFTINVDRDDAHRNGVSTLDLVKIQKHLLGIEAITSPYDLIAADANNSQNVSAIDLVELRKLILGIYTELPNNESWRFVDEDFIFADPTHPWPFVEEVDVLSMPSHMIQDFVAIKVGDVNNTVQANALQILPRNGNGVVNFVADERTVSAGEMVDVAITSADFAGIEGYQFTMQTKGLEFRGIEGGAVSMNEENIGVFGSTLTASWHKVGGVSATSSDVLFTLHFQATAAGKLSQMITLNSRETEAEAYNTASDIKDLKLTFRGAQTGAEFALYQNEPNPFKGNTVIGYDLPEAGNVTLTVFDVTGKAVYVKEQNSVKGYNTIAISSKDMPSIGVLYYRLDANEYTATKKMIIIE